MFVYPTQTEYSRAVPKNKIYEYASAKSSLKTMFVEQVDQIVWQYKLAPATINLSATSAVTEIQVISIELRTDKLDERVLRAIDKAIPYPLFFELNFGGKYKTVAAYKRTSDADSTKWVVDSYFASNWLQGDTPREPLPVALDMEKLYEQMMRALMPLPAREGESLKTQVQRLVELKNKQKEVARLKICLQREKQFNRKVEINAQLRNIQNEVNELSTE